MSIDNLPNREQGVLNEQHNKQEKALTSFEKDALNQEIPQNLQSWSQMIVSEANGFLAGLGEDLGGNINQIRSGGVGGKLAGVLGLAKNGASIVSKKTFGGLVTFGGVSNKIKKDSSLTFGGLQADVISILESKLAKIKDPEQKQQLEDYIAKTKDDIKLFASRTYCAEGEHEIQSVMKADVMEQNKALLTKNLALGAASLASSFLPPLSLAIQAYRLQQRMGLGRNGDGDALIQNTNANLLQRLNEATKQSADGFEKILENQHFGEIFAKIELGSKITNEQLATLKSILLRANATEGMSEKVQSSIVNYLFILKQSQKKNQIDPLGDEGLSKTITLADQAIKDLDNLVLQVQNTANKEAARLQATGGGDILDEQGNVIQTVEAKKFSVFGKEIMGADQKTARNLMIGLGAVGLLGATVKIGGMLENGLLGRAGNGIEKLDAHLGGHGKGFLVNSNALDRASEMEFSTPDGASGIVTTGHLPDEEQARLVAQGYQMDEARSTDVARVFLAPGSQELTGDLTPSDLGQNPVSKVLFGNDLADFEHLPKGASVDSDGMIRIPSEGHNYFEVDGKVGTPYDSGPFGQKDGQILYIIGKDPSTGDILVGPKNVNVPNDFEPWSPGGPKAPSGGPVASNIIGGNDLKGTPTAGNGGFALVEEARKQAGSDPEKQFAKFLELQVHGKGVGEVTDKSGMMGSGGVHSLTPEQSLKLAQRIKSTGVSYDDILAGRVARSDKIGKVVFEFYKNEMGWDDDFAKLSAKAFGWDGNVATASMDSSNLLSNKYVLGGGALLATAIADQVFSPNYSKRMGVFKNPEARKNGWVVTNNVIRNGLGIGGSAVGAFLAPALLPLFVGVGGALATRTIIEKFFRNKKVQEQVNKIKDKYENSKGALTVDLNNDNVGDILTTVGTKSGLATEVATLADQILNGTDGIPKESRNDIVKFYKENIKDTGKEAGKEMLQWLDHVPTTPAIERHKALDSADITAIEGAVNDADGALHNIDPTSKDRITARLEAQKAKLKFEEILTASPSRQITVDEGTYIKESIDKLDGLLDNADPELNYFIELLDDFRGEDNGYIHMQGRLTTLQLSSELPKFGDIIPGASLATRLTTVDDFLKNLKILQKQITPRQDGWIDITPKPLGLEGETVNLVKESIQESSKKILDKCLVQNPINPDQKVTDYELDTLENILAVPNIGLTPVEVTRYEQWIAKYRIDNILGINDLTALIDSPSSGRIPTPPLVTDINNFNTIVDTNPYGEVYTAVVKILTSISKPLWNTGGVSQQLPIVNEIITELNKLKPTGPLNPKTGSCLDGFIRDVTKEVETKAENIITTNISLISADPRNGIKTQSSDLKNFDELGKTIDGSSDPVKATLKDKATIVGKLAEVFEIKDLHDLSITPAELTQVEAILNNPDLNTALNNTADATLKPLIELANEMKNELEVLKLIDDVKTNTTGPSNSSGRNPFDVFKADVDFFTGTLDTNLITKLQDIQTKCTALTERAFADNITEKEYQIDVLIEKINMYENFSNLENATNGFISQMNTTHSAGVTTTGAGRYPDLVTWLNSDSITTTTPNKNNPAIQSEYKLFCDAANKFIGFNKAVIDKIVKNYPGGWALGKATYESFVKFRVSGNGPDEFLDSLFAGSSEIYNSTLSPQINTW